MFERRYVLVKKKGPPSLRQGLFFLLNLRYLLLATITHSFMKGVINMNILGWHKKSNVTLIEKDDEYLVVDKQEKKILYQGDEETCNKLFIMIVAGFIEKEF